MELSLVFAKPLPHSSSRYLDPCHSSASPSWCPAASARLRAQRRFRCVATSGHGEGKGEEVFSWRREEVFSGRRELAGVQPLVEALPPAARTMAELAIADGIGLHISGGSREVAGAAMLGAPTVTGGTTVNSVVPEVVAVGLHNYVAGLPRQNGPLGTARAETGCVDPLAHGAVPEPPRRHMGRHGTAR